LAGHSLESRRQPPIVIDPWTPASSLQLLLLQLLSDRRPGQFTCFTRLPSTSSSSPAQHFHADNNGVELPIFIPGYFQDAEKRALLHRSLEPSRVFHPAAPPIHRQSSMTTTCCLPDRAVYGTKLPRFVIPFNQSIINLYSVEAVRSSSVLIVCTERTVLR